MKQEDKELLRKDLCARLPYGIKVYNTTFKKPTIQTLYGKISDDEFLMEETYTSVGIDDNDFGSFNKRHYTGYIDFIKPYLRQMSSMTEKEKREFSIFIGKTETYIQQIRLDADSMCNPIIGGCKCVYWGLFDKCIDWLNAHHFDYRELIPKGLALEAPKDMYNIK